MMKSHHIIYIPGLNDQHPLNRNLSAVVPLFWKQYGITMHVLRLHWEEGDSIAPKLRTITNMIDTLVAQGYSVSLIGQSAGGSAALNAFYEKRDMVTGIVNITGRVRAGEGVTPTLDEAAKYSPAFKESVQLFEKEYEPKLTSHERKRIMTIKPFWDKRVPKSTVAIPGAINITLPLIEHSLSGSLIVTLYVGKMIDFLNKNS